nr:hypothetical protein [Tanacetum cinerariifolium]
MLSCKGPKMVEIDSRELNHQGFLLRVEKIKALGANGKVSGSRVVVVWMEDGGGIVRGRVVSIVVVKVMLVVLRDWYAHTFLDHDSKHQSYGSCVVGLSAIMMSLIRNMKCEHEGFAAALAALKPKRLKVDKAQTIEKRYGGNKESKKVQRTLLKQQYENFIASSSETLDQTFDRLQKLISQLEIQGEVIEQEDLNLKLLRCLPSKWETHALIWRNKAEIETISLDDLYYNIKVYEPKLTGSLSTSQNPQNVAFVSSNSINNTSSTNEADNTAYGFSTAHTQGNTVNSTSIDNLSDVMICAFLASQPNSPQLAREDLEQIDPDDLEEIDLHWEMAMLTIRARRFIKRTGRNLDINGQKIGFDRKTMPVENPTKNALIAQDRIGGYDWSYQAGEEHPTNFALIALTSSKSSSNSDSEENVRSRSDTRYHAVPLPYTRNYIPSKPDLMFIDKQVESESVDVASTVSSSAVKTVESKVDYVCVKNKGVCSTIETKCVKKNNFSPPIIEDWISDDESEVEFKPKVEDKNVRPIIEKIKFVKTVRETKEKVETPKQHKHYPRGNQRNCFEYLHYVCDQRVVRPVWNNTRRVNNKNFANKMTHPHPKRRFVPQAILTKLGKIKTAGTPVNTVRPVNTADSKPIINYSRPTSNAFKKEYSQAIRPSNKKRCCPTPPKKGAAFFPPKMPVPPLGPSKQHNSVPERSFIPATKGKQHKALYKTKLVNSISKPLHMLHMDLFGPTNVNSLMKKSYYLIITDKFSRFYWVFFFATKDETSGILKTFIIGIENQLDYKVEVIRCDNGTKFKNSVMNQFCDMKRIKREFSVAKTPQQNGVVERKNKTLIKAARTMLVDSKLLTTFWVEAVNTACYVLNRALVIKLLNKTPYELIHGRPPLIVFIKPFGCPVTILKTRDNLGKFDEKADEGFFVGYYVVSKATKVFKKRTMIVEETLNIRFLENAPNVKGNGPDWLFDIDSLTISMNYVSVVAGFQTNGIVGTKDNIVSGQAKKKKEPEQQYILIPICTTDPLISQGPKDSPADAGKKATEVDESQVSDNGGQDDEVTRSEFEGLLQQERQTKHINSTDSFNTVSSPVSTARPSFVNAASPSPINVSGTLASTNAFEEYSSYDDKAVKEEVNMNNVVSSYTIPDAPINKFLKDHPKD